MTSGECLLPSFPCLLRLVGDEFEAFLEDGGIEEEEVDGDGDDDNGDGDDDKVGDDGKVGDEVEETNDGGEER